MGPLRPFGALLRASLCGWLLLSVGCGGGGSGTPGGTGGTNPGGSGGSTGSGGSIGGGTGGSTAGGTPASQCQALVKSICTRFFGSCKLAPDAGADSEAACERQLVVQFGCERATMSYANCLSDTNLISCSSLFTANGLALPGACDAPLNSTPLSDAQTKCFDLVATSCTRSFECDGVTMPAMADLQACVDDGANRVVRCDLVVSVSATYDMCLAALKTATCPPPTDGGADGGADAGAPPPIPSCSGVLSRVQ